MNCYDNKAICLIKNLAELKEEANKTIETPELAVTTGNAIVVFNMLVLQEILEQQACDPIANLANIIQISNSISSLNSSINIITSTTA